MRKVISIACSVLVTLSTHAAREIEKTAEFSVQLSATVQENPPRITLHWPQDSCSQPKHYTIYRKSPGANSWGRATTVSGTATQYTDKNVSVGATYEYEVVKNTPHYTGYGYIYSGINVPLVDSHGKLLLVVDNTYAAQLTNELARLQQDLAGDGWQVVRIDVARNDSPISVKSRIKAQYDSDPINVKSVFLFGHVPVAYSGDIVPDGHCPDHRGAWPCDGFYGDMDGEWTDNTVNDTTASDARNRNTPGDGKYDQSSFPAPLKLMVGRVDLANMPGRLCYGGSPTFPGELDLLRNYLNKDHNFRQKQFDLPRRGIVGDYFGARDGEAFAASGWRNLSTFFDAENVATLPEQGTWIPTLSSNSYLWAYGCGPGSFTSIGGLGNTDTYHDGVTTELFKADIKAAFTMLYGSWLGDWDSEDNFQRGVLALPSYGLTCAWSGRPHWFLQHMALGEPIGYSARLTQNNRPGGLYENEENNCASQIHIALMGDPTLRMHVVAPAANLSLTDDGKISTLNWVASTEPVLGYHVYRSANPDGPFTRLTLNPVTCTSYTDTDASLAPHSTYMVRAVKLETSASGTYYNASQGAFLTPFNITAAPIAATGDTGSPTPTGRENKPKTEELNPANRVTPAETTNSVRALSPTGPTNSAKALSIGSLPGASSVDYIDLALPQVGSNTLHILTPTILELKLINTNQPGQAQVTQWNFVDASGNFSAPSPSALTVTANGQTIAVTGVGFKRRPIYAPFEMYDLRIDNSLYLQLASPISDTQVVEVKNPNGSLWSSTMKFIATADPMRYSPAIHVNHEGYMPNYAKKAMVGYYLGNLGEMTVPFSSGFKIVDATTGVQVFQGTLNLRADVGFPSPAYQMVYEADFTSFNTPGQYRLVVPGMGASLPFMIDSGIAMNFARAYELGLYHQRCGTNTAMPYTRFTHNPCHTAAASVPLPQSSYTNTWNKIAGYAQIPNSEGLTQSARPMTNPSAMLFPYIRQGSIDTTGGHHDAGDYSKYTINCARLVHLLMFEVDSLAGVGELDNMGIPESGDGISDILQEAKWEADYIAKIQDTDGGFYFLTYPVNREYEAFVTPDHGDAQVVWPKTTSVTAAAVAALAQCASSPAFKRAYPAAAATYLQKAQVGWQFLMNAINTYGKNGAYQKITHYGDNYADQDELAWAACEMYLATGDSTIHQKLLSWFDPSSPSTWFWGWWHMFECYGNAIRSYAFAARSGRLLASQLDPTFLGKCQTEIATAGDNALNWSQQSAYGTSLSPNTKAAQQPGWYFSTDTAFDMAVAYQLNPKPEYINAMLANMNYEGGCNPVNVAYITGMGWKRQRDIVSQWHSVTPQTLPPSGIPEGNVTGRLAWLPTYGDVPENLCFPTDTIGVSGAAPFYDRWSDAWNVNAEMVVLNQARGLGTLAFLAAQTTLRTQAWQSVPGTILIPPGTAQVGAPTTLTLSAPAIDLSNARITWEAPGQEPTFGQSFAFVPQGNGSQTVQAEAQLPDGRRIFAIGTVVANASNVAWVDDSIPAGGQQGTIGGDSWNWISSNPSPFSGNAAHQTALASGLHEHLFQGASSTLSVGTGDVLYAYIYLDPANPPSEVMLSWNTGSSWEHRAYWGANLITYGTNDTASRRYIGPLPAAGQWVQLQVPASQVGLENTTVSGMSFSLYNGRATWDAAGVTSSAGKGTTFQPTNSIPVSALKTSTGFKLTWATVPGHTYRIVYKTALTDPNWTTIGSDITAISSSTSWTDTTSGQTTQRFYIVAQIN